MKKILQEDKIIREVKNVHMIGIGGSGMCPIAEILHSKGYTVTGSDNNVSNQTNRLQKLGVKVYMGHSAENIGEAQLVIYSAAIHDDNPEIIEAKAKNIPLMERSKVLGALTRQFDDVIGVCGTHGKTTVSSIITQILYMSNCDPTAVIGGRLPIIDANGIAGKSEFMVCESCEFVDTFLQLSPDVSVLLNIDNDHLDYFKTIDNLVKSFEKFVSMSKIAFVNGDDELVGKAVKSFSGKLIKFGFDEKNDYYADNLREGKFGYKYDVKKSGEFVCTIDLSIPGKHNVLNSLAAFAVADYYNIEVSSIVTAIEAFGGAGRRFERLGCFKGVTLVDDYAHHPSEIAATLSAAKQLGFNNIIAVFQPFTFSRTELLKDEFCEALSLADKIVLTPIMGSREVNLTGISSEVLAEKIHDTVCVSSLEEAANKAISLAGENDLIITMGGGDIYKSAYMMREILQK